MTGSLCMFLTVMSLISPAQAAAQPVPIIYSTDLCHPYDDPDDHFDLACVFAMPEFDIRGIVLDLGEHQATRPGWPALKQMMQITERKIPCALGLSRRLTSPEDAATDEPDSDQGGIRLILDQLRSSREKVLIHTAGSCRDVAAAFNREPELFRQKVQAISIQAGNGPGGVQAEYNVSIGPLSYLRLLQSGLPIYWCPCFGKSGYQTFYEADQAAVVGACAPRVRNFFAYCLGKSSAEPLGFLVGDPKPVPRGPRSMWCTAPLLYMAGRKIYERGPDDFVALNPHDAEKAGLGNKVVDAFRFVPVGVTIDKPPALHATDARPAPPSLSTQLDRPGATTYLFRSNDPRYARIMASSLKNLLAGLGR